MRNHKKLLSLLLAMSMLGSTFTSYGAETTEVQIVTEVSTQEETSTKEEETLEEEAQKLLEEILETPLEESSEEVVGGEEENSSFQGVSEKLNENEEMEDAQGENSSESIESSGTLVPPQNTDTKEAGDTGKIEETEESKENEVTQESDKKEEIDKETLQGEVSDNDLPKDKGETEEKKTDTSVSKNSTSDNSVSDNSVSANSVSENSVSVNNLKRMKMTSMARTGGNEERYSPMEYSWTTKETPLINLAGDLDLNEGVDLGIAWDTVTVTAYKKNLFEGIKEDGGMDKEIVADKPELMLDGDKYNAEPYDALFNPSKKTSDKYFEKGTKIIPDGADEGVWVRVDLGQEYPIEVINLKRGMYVDGEEGNIGHDNGTGRGERLKKYSETIVLAGSNINGAGAYVVHYDVPASANIKLPDGVAIPQQADTAEGNFYQETMGGAWFYMDQSSNGKAYTKIGTTQNARYIWVYSDLPENGGTSERDSFIMFTELAVYGYRSEDRIQQYSKRRTINNENPLFLAPAYSSDTHMPKTDKKAYLQGWNTIEGRWNVIDDKVKPYSVLMMHLNNLGGDGMDHHAGQFRVQDFYQNCLQQAYEANVSTALMLVNASAVPNADGTGYGGSAWNITRDVDYEWVDLMYRMYPNMQGIFNTENYWSYNFQGVATASANLLKIAHNHGGFFLWSEGDHSNVLNSVFSTPAFKDTVLDEYGESIFFTTKTTNGGADALSTQSVMIGNWMAGYIGGWGMLSDTWAWGNSTPSYGDLGVTGYSARAKQMWPTIQAGKPWETNNAVPETLFGMQILTTYLQGGCVYTFEFPEAVYGSLDQAAPAYAHVIEPLYKYIIDHPGPGRREMLNETEILIYGTPPNTVYNTSIGANTKMGLLASGRYEAAAAVSTGWGSIDEVRAKVQATAKEVGAGSPVLIDRNDSLLTNSEYLKEIYPIDYLGMKEGEIDPAFAKDYNGSWYIYNNVLNENVEGPDAKKQGVILPLEQEPTARFNAVLLPHTYMIVEEEKSGEKISVNINNYRVDKGPIIFDPLADNSPDADYPFDWGGSAGTGQGLSTAKKNLYKYNAYYNVVNANTKEGKDYVVHKYTADDYPIDGLNLIQGKDYIDGNPTKTKLGVTVVDGEIRVKQLSPNDNAKRDTTFTITGLKQEPTIKVVNAQAPDTDGILQFDESTDLIKSYNEAENKMTVTVTSNGWVDLEITDLVYEADPNAVKIEDGAEEKKLVDLAEGIGSGEASAADEHQKGQLTASHRPSINNEGGARPLNKMTDGNTGTNEYTNPGDSTTTNPQNEPVWVQIDLGSLQEVCSVDLHRYYEDNRQYANTVVMICPDNKFGPENTLVLWNANGGDADRTPDKDDQWRGIGNGNEDANGTHTLPAGNDGLYQEVQAGKTFPVNAENVKWLSQKNEENLPKNTGADSYKAQYVRVYMNGHKGKDGLGNNNGIHIVEIDVNGYDNSELTDTSNPSDVTGISIVTLSDTEATLSFLPSSDNLGVKNYTIKLTKNGETVKEILQENTRVLLTGLEPGSTYQVEVIATDIFGNPSKNPGTLEFTTLSNSVVLKTPTGIEFNYTGGYNKKGNVKFSQGSDKLEGYSEVSYTITIKKVNTKNDRVLWKTFANAEVDKDYSVIGLDENTRYIVTVTASAQDEKNPANPPITAQSEKEFEFKDSKLQEDPVTALEVVRQPHKKTYQPGEKLNLNGLLVNATYESGATKEIKLADLTTTPKEGQILEEKDTGRIMISYGGIKTETEFIQVGNGHAHEGKFVVNANAIQLICIRDNCPSPNGQLASAALIAPAEVGMGATIVYDEGWKANGLAEDLRITYSDEAGSGLGTEVVTKAGNFSAVVTYEGVTAKIDFVVAQEELAKFHYAESTEYMGSDRVQDQDKNIYQLVIDPIGDIKKEELEQQLEVNQEIKESLTNIPKENRVYLEASLKELLSDKVVQPKASITFILGYPKETDNSLKFRIFQWKNGTTLSPLEEGKEFVKNTDGIYITVDSLGSFLIAWEKEQNQEQPETDTPGTDTPVTPPADNTPIPILDISGDSYASVVKEVEDTTKKVYKLVVQPITQADRQKAEEAITSNAEVKAAFTGFGEKERIFTDVDLKDIISGNKVQPKGKITFILGYPKGTDHTNEFVILHMEQGVIATLLKEGADYVKKDTGIQITVDGFSPFVIGWKSKATGSQTPAVPEQTPTTSSGSEQAAAPSSPGGTISDTVVQNTTPPVAIPVLTPASQPIQPTAPKIVPKTGDNTPVVWLALAFLGSIGILTYYGYRLKKRKQEEKE